MSWFWDLLSKKEQMKQQGRNMAMDVFNKGRASDIRGLLGTAQQDAVIAEGFGSRDRLYEQGLIDKPITGRNSAFSDRLYTPLQEAQAGTGFRGSDMGRGAQTDLVAGLMTEGGLNAQQAYGMLSSELGPQLEIEKGMTPTQQLDAVNKLRTPYEKRMLAPRKAISNYNSAVDLMGKAEFAENNMLTGAESVALTKKYLKQVLPDESVMGDDIATLLKSQGLPEYMKSFLQSIVGSGTMSRDGASEVMRAMQTMASSMSGERDDIRAQYTEEAGQYSLPTTFMGKQADIKPNPLSFEAWKKSRGY